MRVEITVDKTKKLPAGAMSALAIEFNKRLKKQYPDVEATVRMAGGDSLTVMGGSTIDKENIEAILQETWESADDWFQPD
ncbi:DNA damage-inducible protein I [Enterobacteriaceae bacterium ML5]|nr:DNA damage-inducible protein I [Enterobacteriaceae bacterium ML5]